MSPSLAQLNPDFLVYAGFLGVFLGCASLILFAYRRIQRVIQPSSKKGRRFELLPSLRSLLLIIVWTSLFGMALLLGALMRSYHAFTREEPVAEISTHPLHGRNEALVSFSFARSGQTRYLFVKGDQWMIEGDILKWDNWLNMLGLHTRYRLTRLQGRYSVSEEERVGPRTIYPLGEKEDHPLWRYLYLNGSRLPFISSVYGNAVFQSLKREKIYAIFVSSSGFLVREKQPAPERRRHELAS